MIANMHNIISRNYCCSHVFFSVGCIYWHAIELSKSLTKIRGIFFCLFWLVFVNHLCIRLSSKQPSVNGFIVFHDIAWNRFLLFEPNVQMYQKYTPLMTTAFQRDEDNVRRFSCVVSVANGNCQFPWFACVCNVPNVIRLSISRIEFFFSPKIKFNSWFLI